MMKTIYVGNLPYKSNEADIKAMFEPHGMVHSVKLVSDRETGRSKGFGFVEMNQAEADSAIKALNGAMVGGRTLRVNEARERRSDLGGGGGGGNRRAPY